MLFFDKDIVPDNKLELTNKNNEYIIIIPGRNLKYFFIKVEIKANVNTITINKTLIIPTLLIKDV